MSQKRAKQLRKENEIVVVLDIQLARWLQGFFVVLTSTLDANSLNSDTISARQIIRAVEEGLHDDGNTEPADSTA